MAAAISHRSGANGHSHAPKALDIVRQLDPAGVGATTEVSSRSRNSAAAEKNVAVLRPIIANPFDHQMIAAPPGIFPLKRFFGGGTVTANGEEVAWDIIKRKLTEVVAAEDKTSPYSDDELVEKLRGQGFPLARRTVTNYRQMLNIPSSRQRKQHV